MKNFIKTLIFSLFAFTTHAQQATEIDSKSVRLPRYESPEAVIAAIPAPAVGMMIYRTDTKSNWYFDGTDWKDLVGGVSPPLNLTNSGATTFSSTNIGTVGYAGNFENSNSANSNPTLNVVSNGAGNAARIYIDNLSNSNSAMALITLGTGKALNGINNSSTSPTAKLANSDINGLALETNGGLKFGSPNVGVPSAGKVLTAMDALGNATWQNSTLTLPLSQTLASSTPLLNLTNTGTNTASSFHIDNSTNSNSALESSTNGLANAAKFNITNPSSSAAVIEAETSGTGFAGSFQGANSIDANGFVKFKGFTQLGELSPKIKTVEFNQYIGAGSVETITHNLNASKILSINVYASLETGLPPYLRIPPSFISLGTEYYYDYYFDDTKIYFIIPSASTKVKNFFARVLISYKE